MFKSSSEVTWLLFHDSFLNRLERTREGNLGKSSGRGEICFSSSFFSANTSEDFLDVFPEEAYLSAMGLLNMVLADLRAIKRGTGSIVQYPQLETGVASSNLLEMCSTPQQKKLVALPYHAVPLQKTFDQLSPCMHTYQIMNCRVTSPCSGL